jgi:hypothetical protein
MKSIFSCLIVGFLAIGSVSAYADNLTLSGDIGVETNDVYRGELLSNNGSAFGDVKLDNIFLDGLYARVSGNTTNLAPINGASTLPLDYGVGYAREVGNFGYDVSVNHTYNTVFYPLDYTEVRGEVSYKIFDNVKLYTQVGQLVTSALPKDTYGAVGAEYTDKTFTNLTVGVLTSAYRYGGAGTVGNFTSSGDFTTQYVDNHQTKYNNTQLYASYPVSFLPGVSLLGGYSFGGTDRFGDNIGNQGWLGAKYSF